MKKELNISEILKGKPKGIRLYSPIFGDCTFSFIQGVTDAICVIINNNREFFDYKGLFSTLGEVMLFPSKLMRDWSKFAWKKGDILQKNSRTQVIFDSFVSDTYEVIRCKYLLKVDNGNERFIKETNVFTRDYFKVNEEQRQCYINKIEEHFGGKLNMETLEIEKALSFKDGDILSIQEDKEHYHTIFIFKGGTDVYVFFDYFHRVLTYGTKIDENEKSICRLATEDEKKVLFDALAKEGKVWDAEKKMIVDLKSLWTPKPFERVITRNAADDVWTANIFSHMDSHGEYVTIACVGGYTYCIPYNEETAKLIGTTKDVEG